MKAKSIRNLPTTDELTEENGVLIARDGGIFRMLLRNFRNYIAYATGADVLGVPVPTQENAGMSPVVNENGKFSMKHVNSTWLLWENPDPEAAFPEQTIPCDTSGYKMLVVILKHSMHELPVSASFVNDGTEAKLSVFKIGANSRYDEGTGGYTYVAVASEEWRGILVENNGILFRDGVRSSTDAPQLRGGNYAKPIAIYGMR